jgi:hypothetical protein
MLCILEAAGLVHISSFSAFFGRRKRRAAIEDPDEDDSSCVDVHVLLEEEALCMEEVEDSPFARRRGEMHEREITIVSRSKSPSQVCINEKRSRWLVSVY